MQYLTYSDFLELSKSDSYYIPTRWTYYAVVLDLLQKTPFETVLELGSYKMPLVVGSDTMDLKETQNPTYVHDAGQAPWPIGDKQYDMFVGLQVWEHLNGRQREAFAELNRVARHAILSFPLEWICPNDPIHHNITEDMIAEWTNHTTPVRTIIVDTGVRKRIVYEFDFS